MRWYHACAEAGSQHEPNLLQELQQEIGVATGAGVRQAGLLTASDNIDELLPRRRVDMTDLERCHFGRRSVYLVGRHPLRNHWCKLLPAIFCSHAGTGLTGTHAAPLCSRGTAAMKRNVALAFKGTLCRVRYLRT